MASWFDSCINLTEIENLERLDTSEVESFCNTFGYCSSLVSLDLSSFDTSNVIDMELMFGYCEALTKLDLSSFNTKSTKSMYAMFYNCTNLITIYVGDNWNIDNVENINTMFYGYGTQTTIPKGSSR